MSQIQINFDTVTKQATFSMDGAPVEKVVYACVSEYDPGKFYISMEKQEKDEVNQVSTRTSIFASEDGNLPPLTLRSTISSTAEPLKATGSVFDVLSELVK